MTVRNSQIAIAISTCVINLLLLGSARLSSLLYVASVDRYNTDRSAASLPFTLCYVTRNIAGPLVGYVGHKYGLYGTTFFGCLLTAIGVGGCFFAEDIMVVTILWGIIYGLGLGFGASLLPHIVNINFTKHKSMVNGFALAGSCFGAIMMPPLVEFLLKTYGLSGTFLLVSGLVLHSLPTSMLMKFNTYSESERSQPNQRVQPDLSKSDMDSRKSTKINLLFYKVGRKYKVTGYGTKQTQDVRQSKDAQVCSSMQESTPSQSLEHRRRSNQAYCISNTNSICPLQTNVATENVLMTQEIETMKGAPSIQSRDDFQKEVNLTTLAEKDNISKMQEGIKQKQHLKEKTSALSSFRILVDPVFILMAIYQSLNTYVWILFSTIFIDFLRDNGIEQSKEVYIFLGYIIFDMIGRLSLGCLTDSGYMTLTQFFVIFTFITGLGFLACPWIHITELLILVTYFISFLMGGSIAVWPSAIHKFIKSDYRVMAMSSRLYLILPMNFMTPPMIGYFRERLGSYDGVLYILGAITILSCAFAAITPRLYQYRNPIDEEKKETP